MSVRMGWNRCGNAAVQLVRVVKRGSLHDVKQYTVRTVLEDGLVVAHTRGDNSRVLPADTQRNIVCVLAKTHPPESPIQFANVLLAYYLDTQPQITSVGIEIEEMLWNRIKVDGTPHDHAFLSTGNARRTCVVESTSEGKGVQAGWRDLSVLKTTGTGFAGYINEELTTLKETQDRVLATTMQVNWHYTDIDGWNEADYMVVRNGILEVFATEYGRSVQHTLYQMGAAAIRACPAISKIDFSISHQDNLPVDLSPFGLGNDNEVFSAGSGAHGLVEGSVVVE